jgi:hypothetical protein
MRKNSTKLPSPRRLRISPRKMVAECGPQIYTYSRYWIAVNSLVEGSLTRATNAGFAHCYELYIINWELGDSLTLVLF